MKVNLLANRLVPEKVPLVLQYNKQDLEALLPRSELDRTLNFWGRKAFPAVAARGEGVMPTFVAVVQEMLAAIAVKYNLKDKGLDPDAVPEIVAQAFDALLREKPAHTPAAPPTTARRVVVAQPDDAEPAYPGHGAEANPVSEELLHRAIRSNVTLAETLGQLVRDLSIGLANIQTHVETFGAADPATRATAAAIRRETVRLRLVLQELGRAAQPPAAAAPAPSPPASGLRAAPPPAVARGPAQPAAAARPAGTLDALFTSVVGLLRAPLGARGLAVESRLPAGTALPRCSPAALRRALSAFVEGLVDLVAPSSTIGARVERKPVLLRGRDGAEVKRDFLMLTLSHAGGLTEADQQRILKGSDTGPLGEGHRLLREMGGFLRFAPLPGGALETRLFLPL
jgi:hypothetical protein